MANNSGERVMSVETRLRLIAAAERGLAWRRQRIMFARLTVMVMAESAGHSVDWHSLFDCKRHGHHPLDVKWVGPFDMETAIVDTSLFGRSSLPPLGSDERPYDRGREES